MLSYTQRKNLRRFDAMLGRRTKPVATVAFYGPDRELATKVVVGIGPVIRTWEGTGPDVRDDASIAGEVIAHLRASGVRSVAMYPVMIGCPHEERLTGDCRECGYWAGRDRWALANYVGMADPPDRQDGEHGLVAGRGQTDTHYNAMRIEAQARSGDMTGLVTVQKVDDDAWVLTEADGEPHVVGKEELNTMFGGN